ncbi:MAG: hypothetical protein ACU836_10845 [Gammaproteobacteria bacterium]
MAIQKEFVLRYRSAGHVRFQIPERATQAEIGQLIVEKMAALDGIYTVRIFRRSRKMVIHYREELCTFTGVAKHLYASLAELEQQGWFASQGIVDATGKSRFGLRHKLKSSRINRWLEEKMTAAKETAQAAKIIGKLSTKGPKAFIKDPEKAAIDFLNDILVLYLIKTHWTRITQQWLVKPWLHRYEWLATFYLFFLLVRSRRPK